MGKVWDVRAKRFVDERAVAAVAAGAELVLLGETHDNADHHAVQARLVRAMVAAGRKPAVAFEMLDTDQQSKVDAAIAADPRSPDAVARAIHWSEGGWPDFAIYRPLFSVVAEAGLPIVAANLSRAQARSVVRGGASTLAPAVRAVLDRAGALPADAQKDMREEMKSSHCGELPDSLLDPMVTMQRVRDAQLAERLLAAPPSAGAVLIAGTGHVRTDRGVPSYLAREAPRRTVLAVGMLEVVPEATSPEAYAAQFGVETLPLDFVVFTPAAAREDPCEELRQHHRGGGQGGAEPKPVPGERAL